MHPTSERKEQDRPGRGSKPEDGSRQAAVLVPVYRSPGRGLRLVLVRRTEGGVHGGQLAFPGGKRDPGDDSFVTTALREAEEEIGLCRERVEILAELPAANTLTTGFRVVPFLGRIRPPEQWLPAEREIAEVIEADVQSLAAPDAHGTTVEYFPTWTGPREVPFLRVGNLRLWGLSYRIVMPLIQRLMAGEWEF